MKKKTTITNWVSFLLKQIINRIKSRTKLNYWKTSGNDKLPIQKWKKKKRHTYKTITPISGNIRAIGS